MNERHNITPDFIQEKYIELIESATIHLEKRNKPFSPRNISIYLGIFASVLVLFLIYNFISQNNRSIFSNNLTAVAYNKKDILIQDENNIFYQINEDTKEKWYTNDKSFISVDENQITFNKASSSKNEQARYYTLWVPIGKQYNVELVDGTSIHLNSNSTLKFTNTRHALSVNAELIGEAFFDVAHNENSVFRIQASDMSIEVYGTEFNVSNRIRKATSVALIKGSVSVSGLEFEKKFIVPGQQAILDNENKSLIIKEADIPKSLSWETNQIHFLNEPLEHIIRKVENWYPVSFVFNNPHLKNICFTGNLNKKDGITHFLQMLNYTEGIDYKIEKQIITLSK
jgi:hypothetical protein